MLSLIGIELVAQKKAKQQVLAIDVHITKTCVVDEMNPIKKAKFESTKDTVIDTVETIPTSEVLEEFRYRIGDEASSALSDDDIRRFFAARGGSMLKATKMAINNNEWRHKLMEPIRPRGLQFSPNIILAIPDLIQDHAGRELIPAAHYGYDKEGMY